MPTAWSTPRSGPSGPNSVRGMDSTSLRVPVPKDVLTEACVLHPYVNVPPMSFHRRRVRSARGSGRLTLRWSGRCSLERR